LFVLLVLVVGAEGEVEARRGDRPRCKDLLLLVLQHCEETLLLIAQLGVVLLVVVHALLLLLEDELLLAEKEFAEGILVQGQPPVATIHLGERVGREGETGQRGVHFLEFVFEISIKPHQTSMIPTWFSDFEVRRSLMLIAGFCLLCSWSFPSALWTLERLKL
jgi:hypothetical protein